MGAIPVMIGDGAVLPFSDVLDWKSFAVLVSENEIGRIEEILDGIPDDVSQRMHERGQYVYSNYLATLEKQANLLIEVVKMRLYRDYNPGVWIFYFFIFILIFFACECLMCVSVCA